MDETLVTQEPLTLDDFREAMRVFGIEAKDPGEFLDMVEGELSQHPKYEPPVGHTFTPGLYTRSCFVPAGLLFTSKIHKTRHQFVMAAGEISIWTKEQGAIRMRAPFHGITEPGTRRLIFVHQDTLWLTMHPTELTDVDEIEKELIEPRLNPFLEGGAE